MKNKKTQKKVEEEDLQEYQEGYGPPEPNKNKVIFRQEKGFAVIEVAGDVYCLNSTQVVNLGFVSENDSEDGL